MLNMLLAFAVFVLTTQPAELVEDMERAGFLPEDRLRHQFCLPDRAADERHHEYDSGRTREAAAWRPRGTLDDPRQSPSCRLISPVVMSSLINTRERAIALEIRGFEAGGKKTYSARR